MGEGPAAAAMATLRRWWRRPDGASGTATTGERRVRRSATAAGNLAAASVAPAMKGWGARRNGTERKWTGAGVHWCGTTSNKQGAISGERSRQVCTGSEEGQMLPAAGSWRGKQQELRVDFSKLVTRPIRTLWRGPARLVPGFTRGPFEG